MVARELFLCVHSRARGRTCLCQLLYVGNNRSPSHVETFWHQPPSSLKFMSVQEACHVHIRQAREDERSFYYLTSPLRKMLDHSMLNPERSSRLQGQRTVTAYASGCSCSETVAVFNPQPSQSRQRPLKVISSLSLQYCDVFSLQLACLLPLQK